MITSIWRRAGIPFLLCSTAILVFATSRDGEARDSKRMAQPLAREDGASTDKIVGKASAGRDVFRFETFGNEGFWTDAMRMPKGMMDGKITPLQALQIGLLVDIDAVPAAMREGMMAELKTDLSPQNAPMLNDPMMTVKLIEANAIVGIVPKDTNGDGRIDIAGGDKVGVSCALCHTVTDKPVYQAPGAGSVGKIVDGRRR